MTHPRPRRGVVSLSFATALLAATSAAPATGSEPPASVDPGVPSLAASSEPAAASRNAAASGSGAAPSSAAAASTTTAAPDPRAPSPIPELAAVIPGVLLHGSGVWLQHRNQTAQRLLLLEGGAVLATLTSGVILFTTGAARNVVGPTALLAVAGVTTFGVSLLANLYATWAPADGFGEPLVRLPLLETDVGYLYVHDPQFDYGHFITAELSGRVDAWHLTASTAQALDGDNDRLALAAGYRVIGPRGYGARSATGGSFLEPRIGFSQHRFESDGFSSRVFEIALEGRLDIDRYLPDVHGAFFQAEAGWAKQVFQNELPGDDPTTWTSLLLARMGFGLYLGNRRDSRAGGELQLYYDHRHDGFAGGLKVNGLGSGVAGHFGLLGQYHWSPHWGLRVRTEAGSAYTLGLDLVTRIGGW